MDLNTICNINHKDLNKLIEKETKDLKPKEAKIFKKMVLAQIRDIKLNKTRIRLVEKLEKRKSEGW